MGQYFRAVNVTKREYLCPWCLGGGAKLWEWAANPRGAVFTLLLRRSSEGGGGDYYGYHRGFGEGTKVHKPAPFAGRWAGDTVYLVGDYDDSGLYQQAAERYANISQPFAKDWNAFIELKSMQLQFDQSCSCQKDVNSSGVITTKT